jgi:polyisoprenoid-binding protein YceI
MNTMRLLFPAALAISFLAGCDNDPSKGTTKVQTTEAAPLTNTPKSPSAKRYQFSASDSKIGWVGAKVTGKHDGTFGAFTGSIELVDADPSKSSVSVDIDMNSVTSDQEKLTGHLKSPDLFDVAKYPKARFLSTAIRTGGENGATHTITGNLELHGVTRSITFPANIQLANGGATVRASFAINRKDFGIVYPGMPDDLIKDDVALKLEVNANPLKS